MKRVRKDSKGALGVRSYRSIYDTMAMTLQFEPVFTISRVIRKVGITSERAKRLLSFMKERGLIEELSGEDLIAHRQNVPRRYFKVTDKGNMYVSKYNELLNLVR